MVIHNYKTIFFHVPKVAGYTIEQYLLPGRRDYKVFDKNIIFGLKEGLMTQHITYNSITKYIDEETLNKYYKFAFFRNTWDRLCSAFCYMEPHYIERFGSFENCIKNACKVAKNNDYQEGWHFCKQTDYLFDKNGNVVLDFVGQYSNLDEEFKTVCEKVGAPIQPLRKLNISKSKTRHYREYYTEEIKQLVYETYKEEIDYFKYTF